MKCLGGSLPSGQAMLCCRNAHNPDISARIFVKPEYVIADESVFARINGLRSRVGELFYSVYFREAIKAMAGNHPPLSCVILKCDLIPAPPEVSNASGNIWSNCGELFAIELMDELVRDSRADNIKLAGLVTED